MILATCNNCGRRQGKYKTRNELINALAGNACNNPKCDTNFQYLPDGRIWDLNETHISDKETHDFWSLINKKIIKTSKQRFQDGHHADSAEAAFKEVNSIVKKIYKKRTSQELDGKNLMLTAFSANNPIIKLGDISSMTGKDIQEGYMHIFAGAISAIRNPKAHENIRISPERAIHFIFLASLLMDKLEEEI